MLSVRRSKLNCLTQPDVFTLFQSLWGMGLAALQLMFLLIPTGTVATNRILVFG